MVGAVGIVATAGLVALVQAAIPDRDGVIKPATRRVSISTAVMGGTNDANTEWSVSAIAICANAS